MKSDVKDRRRLGTTSAAADVRRRPSWRRQAPRWLLSALLAVMCIPFVTPFLWMISASFKPLSEIFRNPPTLLPDAPTLDGYVKAFTLQPFALQYFNSLYIAVVVTLGTMLVASLAGYAFARIRFRGANALFVMVLLGVLVPAEVTIVPLFQLVQRLGLADTHWPLIFIPMLGAPSVLATFIMRQFFLSLPIELEEAGRLDGLSRNGIFWRIALPLAGPALAAVAIFTFLKSWNLYLEPLVFLSSREMFTLPIALTQYQDGYSGQLWDAQLAATTLTVIPMLLVFLFAQRQFVQGLSQTGLKG